MNPYSNMKQEEVELLARISAQKRNYKGFQKSTVLIKKMSNSNLYKCEYCGPPFTREKTLAVHMCEKKRRRLQKDEKRVQTGYYAFTRFYKLSAGTKKEKTYEDFCASPIIMLLLSSAVLLTMYDPSTPEKYIYYVVTPKSPNLTWCPDELYEKYATELVLKESMDTAIERPTQYNDGLVR